MGQSDASPPYERIFDGFLISSDPAKLQIDVILGFLARSYWASNRPPETIERSIENSLCFGVYRSETRARFGEAGGYPGGEIETADAREDAAVLDGSKPAPLVQVGFARVVTDRATFAWLCDVFIAEEVRDRGLGKRLIETVVAHPDLQGLRRWMLATADAHALYRQFGFAELSAPERWMERFTP